MVFAPVSTLRGSPWRAGREGKIEHLPQGIPSFTGYTNCNSLHKEEKKHGVYWLESVDSPMFTLADRDQFGRRRTINLLATLAVVTMGRFVLLKPQTKKAPNHERLSA